MLRNLGKTFDLRGFAEAFGEAFDARGFARAFREACDLPAAGRSVVAGFRNGAALVGAQLHRAAAALHVGTAGEAVEGSVLLQRLLADVYGGGGSAVRALAEIRSLLRPSNPEIDRLPDDHIPGLVQRIINDLQKPAARPEDFTGAVARALAEAQARAAGLEFAEAAQVLDAALARAKADDHERAHGRAALLAERGRIARLQLRYPEAAGFYRLAVEAVAFEAHAAWQHRLEEASAWQAQGEEFGDNAALREAIACYRDALRLVPREQAPLDWAMTQNNLGNALTSLGERESGTARLEEAVAAFRAALGEWTRERVPLDWATTQNNLGAALASLGEREGGTARLEEAVAAFRAALGERTRERVPLDWAMTQNNLGNALRSLGERESGTVRLEEAVAAFDDALSVLMPAGAQYYIELCRSNRTLAAALIEERGKQPA